jgi:hypothetical protein
MRLCDVLLLHQRLARGHFSLREAMHILRLVKTTAVGLWIRRLGHDSQCQIYSTMFLIGQNQQSL